MAVDTAAKRASALNAFQSGVVYPIPSGTVGEGPRQHMGGFYSGISAVYDYGEAFCIAAATRAYLAIVGDTRAHRTIAGNTRHHMGVAADTR